MRSLKYICSDRFSDYLQAAIYIYAKAIYGKFIFKIGL